MLERIASFLKKYRYDCKKLKNAFYDFESNKWNKQTYCLELFIQLSHYIYVLMDNDNVKKEIKEEFRNLNDIVDEICDVIYQVINILNECDLKIDAQNNFIKFDLSQECKKEMCIVLAGQIADAVLRKEEYKHANNRSVNKEDELILKNCTYILLCIFDDIERLGINIEKCFSKMLNEAWHYIKKQEVRQEGFYSENIREEIITKKIDICKISEIGIFFKELDYKTLIYEYINQLKFKYISVISPIYIKQNDREIIMAQSFVDGIRLDKYIELNVHKKPHIVVQIFTEIYDDLILLYNNNPNVRVDSNLCNFIIENFEQEHRICLVDIYPPIILNKIEKNKNNLLSVLMIDFDISLTAFLYYFVRTIVRCSKRNNESKQIIEDILLYANKQHCIDLSFTNDIETKKIYKKYFVDKIHFMYKFYDLPEEKAKDAFEEIRKWSIRKEMVKNNDI